MAKPKQFGASDKGRDGYTKISKKSEPAVVAKSQSALNQRLGVLPRKHKR